MLTVKNPIESEHVTRKCNPSLLKKTAYLYLGVKQYKSMRASKCFDIKTKGIMKAEVDLSLNYTYYLRNGLICDWRNYVFKGGKRENQSIFLFSIFPETLKDVLNIRLFCG